MKKLNKKITGYIAVLMAVALCIGIIPVQNVNASETVADVEAELTLDKEVVVLGDEDIIEDEWVYEEYYRLYAENVYITLTVQGKVESIYSNAYVRFDYQTVYMSYDSSSSTETTTVYKGDVVINQYTPGDQDYVLDEVYLARSDNGQRERVQCSPKTLTVTRDFADKELPQLTSVSLDKQGETINTGQVVISIKASDNVGIDEDNSAVSVRLGTTLEGVQVLTWYHDYETQESDGTYKVVINVTAEGISQSKWYIQEINLYDTVRNKSVIEYGQDSPYYFYIDQTGQSGNTPEQPGTTPEQPGNTPEQPGNTPEQPSNTPETPGNEPEETIKEITPVKDETTETAINNEVNQLISDVLAGRVSEDTVDTQTADKISQAISNGTMVDAELVLKEMTSQEVENLTEKDKTAIEDKVVAEFGKNANIQYLDLSLILKAGNEELGTLNKLREEITITIAVPEKLKAEGRTYKVIRNHNGEVTVLDTVVNEDGTISFKTDRFSTYALVYADKEETSSKPIIKPVTDTNTPKTGDGSYVLIYIAIGLTAMYVLVVIQKRKTFVK